MKALLLAVLALPGCIAAVQASDVEQKDQEARNVLSITPNAADRPLTTIGTDGWTTWTAESYTTDLPTAALGPRRIPTPTTTYTKPTSEFKDPEKFTNYPLRTVCFSKGWDPTLDGDTVWGCFLNVTITSTWKEWVCDNKEFYLWKQPIFHSYDHCVMKCEACWHWAIASRREWIHCHVEVQDFAASCDAGFMPIPEFLTSSYPVRRRTEMPALPPPSASPVSNATTHNTVIRYASLAATVKRNASTSMSNLSSKIESSPETSTVLNPRERFSASFISAQSLREMKAGPTIAPTQPSTALLSPRSRPTFGISMSSSSSHAIPQTVDAVTTAPLSFVSSDTLSSLSDSGTDHNTASDLIDALKARDSSCEWNVGHAANVSLALALLDVLNISRTLNYGAAMELSERWKVADLLNISLDDMVKTPFSFDEALPAQWAFNYTDIDSNTTKFLDARGAANASHVFTGETGFECFSQGYSPYVSHENFLDFLDKVTGQQLPGEFHFYKWYVQFMVMPTSWHDKAECFRICKPCLAWGADLMRSMVSCKKRGGPWPSFATCHIGWEPLPRTMRYFRTITTDTDAWAVTPFSFLKTHYKSILDTRPTLTVTTTPAPAPTVTTRFILEDIGQPTSVASSAKATEKPDVWDILCAGALAADRPFDPADTSTSSTSKPAPQPTATVSSAARSPKSSISSWTRMQIRPTGTLTEAITSIPDPWKAKRTVAALQNTPKPTITASHLSILGASTNNTTNVKLPSDESKCKNACDRCVAWAAVNHRPTVKCEVSAIRQGKASPVCTRDFTVKLPIIAAEAHTYLATKSVGWDLFQPPPEQDGSKSRPWSPWDGPFLNPDRFEISKLVAGMMTPESTSSSTKAGK